METVVAGGWLETVPRQTKKVKILLEALGWLSKTSQIRSAPANAPGEASGPGHGPAPGATPRRQLPLTDAATAALAVALVRGGDGPSRPLSAAHGLEGSASARARELEVGEPRARAAAADTDQQPQGPPALGDIVGGGGSEDKARRELLGLLSDGTVTHITHPPYERPSGALPTTATATATAAATAAPRFIDLFAGVGGFRLGLEVSGTGPARPLTL